MQTVAWPQQTKKPLVFSDSSIWFPLFSDWRREIDKKRALGEQNKSIDHTDKTFSGWSFSDDLMGPVLIAKRNKPLIAMTAAIFLTAFLFFSTRFDQIFFFKTDFFD